VSRRGDGDVDGRDRHPFPSVHRHRDRAKSLGELLVLDGIALLADGSESALLQQRLWSADPEAWALFSEPHNLPLFEAVLAAAGVARGTTLLDVACGTGMLLQLAAAKGATVSGVDVSGAMLGIAAARLPHADLRLLDLQVLPYADESFDVVTAVNAFAFAEDPVAAIAESARVLRAGGRLVIGMFAEPERSQSTAIHEAMTALSPPERSADHRPYALSAPGNLEAAIAAAGLVELGRGEVECLWSYANTADAVRGLRGSGGGARAVEDVGAEVVGVAIERALLPFTEPVTGRVTMVNTFRWLSAGTS
jgi:SAM-dependent methyltransferase